MKNLLENKLFKVLVGSIILIILVIIIVIVIVSGQNKKVTEQNLIAAAEAYYNANPTLLPKENYDSTTVQLSTLVNSGYISSDKEGANCPSYVIATNMNGKYSYTPFIKCNVDIATTPTLMSKITADMTNTGSGFYNYDGKYIYRGENPNNYVKFADTLWRIIGLDENNNIKMIYSDVYVDYYEWDNRYNKDIEEDKGINEFIGSEKSRIKEYLDSFFSNKLNIDKFTAPRIARITKFNTCIGKVDITTGNIDICSETYRDRIATLTIDDYLDASLDESCSLDNTLNCRNYNFLNLDGWTINANSSNSYQAYFIDEDKGVYSVDAYIRGAVRPVIALKNDVIYASGSGTITDPYMIG